MKKTIAMILALALLLPGCWDSREINELGLVIAVGIDKAPGSDNYLMTVQIANPKPSAQSGGGQDSSSAPYIILTAEGGTLFEATRALATTSSKRIMWAHDYIIVIGESVARDSIAPVVDYFTHNPELRMKTPVVVAEGNAKDCLAIKTGMEDMPGVSLSSTYAFSRLTATFIETDMLSLSQDYYGEYVQPLISRISITQNKVPAEEGDKKSPPDQVQFGGAAVFRKDKMLGWLTPEETQGLAWILNQTSNTIVTVAEPGKPGKLVSIETRDMKAKITPHMDGENLSASIEITGSASIVEEDSLTTMPMEEFKSTLEGYMDASIGNTVKKGLSRLQKEYRSDALGLARYFHAKYDKRWEDIVRNRWDEVFAEMPIDVSVNIDINESTLYQIPEPDTGKD